MSSICRAGVSGTDTRAQTAAYGAHDLVARVALAQRDRAELGVPVLGRAVVDRDGKRNACTQR
jgi:hypothetical protein